MHLSGADIESIIVRARRAARLSGRVETIDEDLRTVAAEFTPARDEVAIEFQELVAAREATSRSMLPPRLHSLPASEIANRIALLRSLVR